MTAIASNPDDVRLQAARLAAALIRFEQAAAHLAAGSTPRGTLRVGTEAYQFLPSWRTVPREEVERFLVALPSPAFLAPTTIRGVIALTLLHELSGERRQGAEKTLRNYAAGLDDLRTRTGLGPASSVLLEFDDESHVFSFAAVREWAQQFPVQVAWNVRPLDGGGATEACLMLIRSDSREFPGRSCIVGPRFRPRQ
jgi:hypothetical protein